MNGDQFLITALLALAGAMLATAQVEAQTPAEFYKGKRIALITSASVGGGYDQYARFLAKHMPRFIPGNPTIVVQNMPGADGIRAANHLYKVAAQDGMVIGGLSRNTGLIHFYDPNNASVQFDARKFHWLGSPQQEIGLFILRRESGAKSIDDLKRIEVTAEFVRTCCTDLDLSTHAQFALRHQDQGRRGLSRIAGIVTGDGAQ